MGEFVLGPLTSCFLSFTQLYSTLNLPTSNFTISLQWTDLYSSIGIVNQDVQSAILLP